MNCHSIDKTITLTGILRQEINCPLHKNILINDWIVINKYVFIHK